MKINKNGTKILDEIITRAAELPTGSQSLLLMMAKEMASTHGSLDKKKAIKKSVSEKASRVP